MDEIITVTDEDAYGACRLAAKTEGLLWASAPERRCGRPGRLSLRPENQGKRIVVVLPDTGERYLSAGLFDQSGDGL